MDFKKIKAILMVKDYGEENKNKFRMDSSTDGGLTLSSGRYETEVLTKYDMKDPQQENFEKVIQDVIDNKEKAAEQNVKITFLTEYEF